MLKAANDAGALQGVLLREGNHRIKNSLQIVSSLLSLQAGQQDNDAARDALHTAAARIQAVASMHDALQDSEGPDWIDLGAALRMMCRSLQEMGGASGVNVQVTAETLLTPVDFAQPLLLAVNELVLNAMRHAFPDNRAGSVVVTLGSAGGQLHVVVADDGVGLTLDNPKPRGFGMTLVETMTDKIKGSLYIDISAGTKVTITTPEPQPASAAQSVEGMRSRR
jgi:two-component sensor histidine kinase